MTNEIITKELPNKLQDFMDKMIWSRAETSRKTGLADQTIKKMLNNEITTRISKIKAAKPFGVSPKEIFPDDTKL